MVIADKGGMMQIVQIRGAASRGGAKLVLASTLCLLILLLALPWLEQLHWWYAILIISAAMTAFAGWAKLAEPKYFLEYDEQGLHYHHRLGSWHLPWDSFLFCGVPELNQQALGYIGIKLKDYQLFLQQLPPRLAVRLMTEQRTLYLETVRQGCAQGQCATELLSEKEYFDTANAHFSGIKASFAWRMLRLADATGFELFIPVNTSAEDSMLLCRQINQSRLQLIPNTVT